MEISQLPLNALRAFEASARLGSFTRAGLELRVTQTAVSHQVKALEEALGVTLFTRLQRGLDFFIRFGDGAWHGTDAIHLMDAPLSPVCMPSIAARLRKPADLANEELLRSYRVDEWPLWFKAAGVKPPGLRGWMFDSSRALVEAAVQGAGVALVPVAMFTREIEDGRVVQPFAITASAGSYWLTHLKSRAETPSLNAFRTWILAEIAAASATSTRRTKPAKAARRATRR